MVSLRLLRIFSVAALIIGLSPSMAPAEWIGFEFTSPKQVPQFAEGDRLSTYNLFIDNYAIPSYGVITGLRYLHDSDRVAEAIDLLILRPTAGGWDIVHQLTLPADDHPKSIKGVEVVDFDAPLEVQEGDVFAHWKDSAGGPFPVNVTSNAVVDGRTIFGPLFFPEDLGVGQHIDAQRIIGTRGLDYFVNVRFEAVPEPSSIVLAGLGLVVGGLGYHGCRSPGRRP